MRKIALINPPYRGIQHSLAPHFPLGLGYIKAVCEENHIKCDLFDFSASDKSNLELLREYRLDKYDVLGISSYSIIFNDIMKFSKIIKQKGQILVVGGHHASLCRKKILEDFPIVDYCLSGFGEYTFCELIKNLDNNNKFLIPGICYKNGNKIIEKAEDYREFNLNDLPLLDRNNIIYDFNKDNCIDTSRTVLNISTSRGCPYKCTYCVNCKNSYWLTRDITNIMLEIRYEFSMHNYSMINFVDCNFYVNPKRAQEIIETIKTEFPHVSFNFQTRSDQVVKNEAHIKNLITKNNCNICLGIESNSNSVLKRFNKETNQFINQKAVDIIASCGRIPTIYIIMFDPLMNLSDIRETFDFIKKNNFLHYNSISNLYQSIMPFYGSKYYDNYKEFFTGSIHSMMKAKYINSDVEKLYMTLKRFRNDFEDDIRNIIIKIESEVYYEASTQVDMQFLKRSAYLVFEYFLIMLENFSTCDMSIFKETQLYALLTDTIKKYQ